METTSPNMRDADVRSALRAAGWESLVIWECKVKDTEALAQTVKRFLNH
jgi:G:T-mismatch repair DNA endonuclease (very short patch repair protein)